MLRVVIAGLFLLSISMRMQAQDVGAEIDFKESVVKLTVTQRAPNFTSPWIKANPAATSGTGFIINGNRVITNAHVVRYGTQIYVQPNQSDEKYEAKVVAISYALDLALLELEDPQSIADRKPIPIDETITPLRTEVNVYGYPIGGDQISITKGIVSRIEHTVIGGTGYGLRVQIDAAINPGNSGGPALSNGKVVGVAFSGIQNANNIGYIIHSSELAGFLKDVEDGTCDGKPNLWLSYQNVENVALRSKLKLPKNSGGVFVSMLPEQNRNEDFPLKVGDVITKIGPHAIDSLGNVKVQELTLSFLYYVAILEKEGTVPLTVWRQGKEVAIQCPTSVRLRTVMPLLNGAYPRYFIVGPMTFEAASYDFAYGLLADKQWSNALAILGSPMLNRLQSPPESEGEELLVVPSQPFSHKVTKGYTPAILNTVKSINGQKILNLVSLVEFFRDCRDEYIEIEFNERGSHKLIFNRAEMVGATDQILSDNNIRKQFSDDLEKVWDGGKSRE